MALKVELSEDVMTKYEKARMLGARATQIAHGAPILVKLTKKELEQMHFSPMQIAKKEFEKGLIPMEIRRILPHQRLR